MKFNVNLKNDITDTEELHDHIKNTYPNLNFEIVLVLMCGKCFESNQTYSTSREKLYIFNNSTMNDTEEERRFYEIYYKCFGLKP